MTYRGEQEYKPNKHRLEVTKIPVFTKYEMCVMCMGRGYKQEMGGFNLIPCPVCQGKKKVPVTDYNGQFVKR